jgi:hypothetical protein
MAGLNVRPARVVASAQENETPMVSFKEARGSSMAIDRRQQEFRGRRSLIPAAGAWQIRDAGTGATPSAGAFPYGRIRHG